MSTSYKKDKEVEKKSKKIVPPLTEEQERFVKKVSLGALGLGWFWMIFSKLYRYAILSFFINPANIVLALIFFFTGRKSAWESGEWESFEAFKKKQEQLDMLAIIIWVLVIGLIFFVFIIGS